MSISKKMKLLWQNPKYRKHMSDVHKGQKAWNKGKKLHYKIWNKGTKGLMPIPWNKGTKGIMRAWNKGLHPDYVQGKNNYFWKNGKSKSRGYIIIKQFSHPYADSNHYIKRSHLVMEKMIGRYLKKGEVVHHINHIRTDDRPKNLQLFANQSKHMKFEHPKKVKRVCIQK